MNEIERFFRQDSSEKKRTAHSASKRVGRTKKCTMPYELLRGKEKKEYMKPGEVQTVKLAPMSLKEFKVQPQDIQVELLNWYGERYGWGPSGIQHGLGISLATANRLLDTYNLRKVFRTKMDNATKEDRARFMLNRANNGAEAPAQVDSVNTQPEEKSPVQKPSEPPSTFFGIQLKGRRFGSVLKNNLQGFALSLDENAEYSIDLLIVQRTPAEQGESNIVDA